MDVGERIEAVPHAIVGQAVGTRGSLAEGLAGRNDADFDRFGLEPLVAELQLHGLDGQVSGATGSQGQRGDHSPAKRRGAVGEREGDLLGLRSADDVEVRERRDL